ncbi:MAG: 4Fe-4S dicluster domain-containing protein [Saprospiraceae bacterium]|nr:4Fe-4S dicluster domain-containing protein [Candidatus Opimibacter skivensis]MBL0007234.1 4Fe-4S dicluster domain-containing protein [Candidatus Opimibacter skivensis]
MEERKNEQTRRAFFSKTVPAALGVLGVGGLLAEACKPAVEDEEKVSVLTPDGKLVQVNKSAMAPQPVSPEEAREGIPGKKFVMVIDLARCKNARKCVSECQKMHNQPAEDEWIKVFLMQDSEDTAPYWFPKPCFHCNQPPCVKVCPVGATYKRTDGIVLVDTDRCIGCKFCMTACPYSSRVFQWKEEVKTAETCNTKYSPETSVPSRVGTVGKCDFCPDMARQGKLPGCVTGCPNGVIFFGDKNEDIVTNGSESFRFSELVHDRAGYHFMAELGTEPNVYYLPPVDRLFDYEKGFNDLSEEQVDFYKSSIVKKH